MTTKVRIVNRGSVSVLHCPLGHTAIGRTYTLTKGGFLADWRRRHTDCSKEDQ